MSDHRFVSRPRPKLLDTGAAGFRGRRRRERGAALGAALLALAAASALAGFGAADGSAVAIAAEEPTVRPATLVGPRPDRPFQPEARFANLPAHGAAPEQAAEAVPEMRPPVPKPQRAAPRSASWRNAAPPVAYAPDQPLLAIVIDDLGFDQKRTDRVAALPGPLTLAFLPYARGADAQARAARMHGHELLLHMPMEPLGPENPGPGALRVSDDPAALRRKLAAAFERIDGVVGLNNHMGSRFTAAAGQMRIVAQELRERGMLFLDSRTSTRAIGAETAQKAGLAWAGRDVFLDDDPSLAAVDRQFRAAIRKARQAGVAVAIGHPYDTTLKVLARHLPGLAEQGIALAPISEVARLNRLRDVGRTMLAEAE